MESGLGYYEAKAALEWQMELGADEAIGEAPVDRYALATAELARAQAPVAASVAAVAPVARAQQAEERDPVGEARKAAAGAGDLAALAAAMAAYEHCELKRGARQLVFADGLPAARLMIIGEAPGREEDIAGKPFVGRAGQLLDRMLGAIEMGRDREEAPVYITNLMPWRPPQNRDPKPEEIAMMLPFLERHVALIDPEVVVLMGNTACQAVLGKRGIMRLRGQWSEAFGRPALAMFHPAYLLRQPAAKRETWADLLSVKAKLAGGA